MAHDKINPDDYKPRLLEYLTKKNLNIDNSKSQPLVSCVSANHEDIDPSMSIYPERVNCNSCGFKGDIFDCAGELILKPGKDNFIDQLKDIQSTLGEVRTAEHVKKPVKKVTVKNVELEREKALEIYSEETVLKYANFILNKNVELSDSKYRDFKIIKFYPFYDENKLIDLCVVRFEDQHGEKEVLTYYYDGKNVKMKAYPVLVYNRHLLAQNPDKPVIIHEGEKCCDISGLDKKDTNGEITNLAPLPDFTHTTWNGGGKKCRSVQGLEIFKGRDVYLLPDDDQKTDKHGELLPHEKQPGQKTMIDLKKRLWKELKIKAEIIPVFEKARSIKPDGADIEEILQCYSPGEIKNIILGCGDDRGKSKQDIKESNSIDGNAGGAIGNVGNFIQRSNVDIQQSYGDTDIHNPVNGSNGNNDNPYPFQILGIADDGRARFIDYESRILDYKTTEINANVLADLAGLDFFTKIYSEKITKEEWAHEVDTVRKLSKSKDFNIENLKGRGAWRSKSGDICYYDGKKITGTPDPDWTFVRKPQKPPGINKNPASLELRLEIMYISKRFSLGTKADNIRLLSWSAIAAFGGALKWRTMILCTGASGWGKSTIVDNVVRPISFTTAANGARTTEPGIRQENGIDSNSIFIDEAEAKRHKDRERMEPIFALGRASTTDDTPKTFLGGKAGIGTSYAMKSMFGFAAVNPSVEDVANDNRIIRVNFKKPDNFETFLDDIEEIKKLLSIENCQSIRSYVWQNLKKIMDIGDKLFIIIQRVTGQDARFAAGESILLACNMIVWEDIQDFSQEFLTEYVQDFYSHQNIEEKRDETNEMIVKLLDETIIIGTRRETRSLRDLLIEMKKYLDNKYLIDEGKPNISVYIDIISVDLYKEYKTAVEQWGISVHGPTRELVIASRHARIKKILEAGISYHKELERHSGVITHKNQINPICTIDKASKRATILTGFLNYFVDKKDEIRETDTVI